VFPPEEEEEEEEEEGVVVGVGLTVSFNRKAQGVGEGVF
jgi:hypothetical protein